MTQKHHLHTFANTKAFTDAYNEGTFAVPYIAVIDDIRSASDHPMVLFSNRLPYKDGVTEAPQTLSHKTGVGQWVLGASRL